MPKFWSSFQNRLHKISLASDCKEDFAEQKPQWKYCDKYSRLNLREDVHNPAVLALGEVIGLFEQFCAQYEMQALPDLAETQALQTAAKPLQEQHLPEEFFGIYRLWLFCSLSGWLTSWLFGCLSAWLLSFVISCSLSLALFV
ncbi:hypothetical protein GJ496_008242 [Pomphorhynchus laevis]|nr:hypothetical protein GJ496_008242 [Pomphorhynchus laevis]